MDASTLLTWTAAILSGIATLILVPLGIYYARYAWDIWRWQKFEKLIQAWATSEIFPNEMTDEDWHVVATTKLSEAKFEPQKMKEFLELAIWFAKGSVNQMEIGRLAIGRKDDKHGEPEPPR